jgi:hypothetical protein
MNSNQNYGGWTVRYGCQHWSDAEGDLTEAEARQRYWKYCRNPPVQGKYPADFILLENDAGKTVDSFSTEDE